ncbi:hypothetical protein RUND412_006549 [Rhizina undulata]
MDSQIPRIRSSSIPEPMHHIRPMLLNAKRELNESNSIEESNIETQSHASILVAFAGVFLLCWILYIGFKCRNGRGCQVAGNESDIEKEVGRSKGEKDKNPTREGGTSDDKQVVWRDIFELTQRKKEEDGSLAKVD